MKTYSIHPSNVKCQKAADLMRIPDIPNLAAMRRTLLAHLKPIGPQTATGKCALFYLSQQIAKDPAGPKDAERANVLLNVLHELKWIKFYFRAITQEEFSSLVESRGRSMVIPRHANFSPSPFSPILAQYRQEISYADEIIMIPGLPGIEFTTKVATRASHEGNWPRLKKGGPIESHKIWFLDSGIPKNAKFYFSKK